MRHYYRSVFPAGSKSAQKHYHAARLAISENPHIGRPLDDEDEVRIHSIARTPFAFVYRLAPDAVEVMRVLDGRSEDANELF